MIWVSKQGFKSWLDLSWTKISVTVAFNRNANIARLRWIVGKLGVGSMEEGSRSSSHVGCWP